MLTVHSSTIVRATDHMQEAEEGLEAIPTDLSGGCCLLDSLFPATCWT